MRSTPTRRQFLTAAAAVPAVTLVPRRQQEEREILPLAATLVLVRHTEKAKSGGVDPDLSEAGHERAAALSRMFGAAGVTQLVHSEYKRTRDTLAPLAKALELESVEIGAREMPRLLARLSAAKADQVIVVAGHSNTIPGIAFAFGVDLPDLDETVIDEETPFGDLPYGAYDRVHVLTPGEKAARLVELRYGEPS